MGGFGGSAGFGGFAGAEAEGEEAGEEDEGGGEPEGDGRAEVLESSAGPDGAQKAAHTAEALLNAHGLAHFFRVGVAGDE